MNYTHNNADFVYHLLTPMTITKNKSPEHPEHLQRT